MPATNGVAIDVPERMPVVCVEPYVGTAARICEPGA
jgi:hypothetical protein